MKLFDTNLYCACLLSLLLLSPRPGLADQDLQLDGKLTQGGLVIATTEPGAKASLNGRAIRVSDAGRFLFGFGREAPTTAELRVELPDGRVITRTLEITSREYDVQRIDGLPQKKVTPPPELTKRIQEEAAKVAAVRKRDRVETDFESGFVWPATGRISGVYGSQRILNGIPKWPHYGIDVAAPAGTPIKAPADGLVVLAEPDFYYSGGTVILDHGHGLSSAFLHLQSITVEVGQRLRQGDQLGTLGATGRATGPHLDWRINWFEQRVDPQLVVGPMPAY